VPLGVYPYPPDAEDSTRISAVQIGYAGELGGTLDAEGIAALRTFTKVNDWMHNKLRELLP
jgi:hypothetical protein